MPPLEKPVRHDKDPAAGKKRDSQFPLKKMSESEAQRGKVTFPSHTVCQGKLGILSCLARTLLKIP